MAFEEVERRPVYQQVAAQLRAAILDGELAPGHDLPSERELGLRFGVGRTSVREALRALQAQGLVVAAGPTAPLRVTAVDVLSEGPVGEAFTALLRLGGVPLGDLIELRGALEGAALAATASRRPRPDLADATAALAAMDAAGTDVDAFEVADVQFHLALVEASGNSALRLVMLAVRSSISEHLREALHRVPDVADELDRLRAEHAAILAAVREGRADDAARTVGDHIRGLYERTTVAGDAGGRGVAPAGPGDAGDRDGRRGGGTRAPGARIPTGGAGDAPRSAGPRPLVGDDAPEAVA
ncbi:FCD domain-containing protein [Patulibacter sp. SYSU D01012]|uniref:FadR/GntR family transcriptional regulator n=1 Tax=Patulibacter sp. SYSU D01012 TaxID=2817381 RepID=UPI001B30165C|nr:FCD domain-containing protein [Patulibacter sp. SYSU D01012]